MVERRKELNQRYQRKKKMSKLKAKLATAKDARDKDAIVIPPGETKETIEETIRFAVGRVTMNTARSTLAAPTMWRFFRARSEWMAPIFNRKDLAVLGHEI